MFGNTTYQQRSETALLLSTLEVVAKAIQELKTDMHEVREQLNSMQEEDSLSLNRKVCSV